MTSIASHARSFCAQHRLAALAVAAFTAAGLSGCALTPHGFKDERAAVAAAGAAFAGDSDPEALPLPADGDDWRTLLRRALLANGDVHAAWYEWKAAVERVPAAASWPNSNITVGYSYLFSDESVKSFNRNTFAGAFDSMENLSFPGKAMASGRVALANARAAGEKFRAAKFAVQRRLLEAWLDFALAAEDLRLAGEGARLAVVGRAAADAALAIGAGQKEAVAARVVAARSEDSVASANAALVTARNRLAATAAIEDASLIGTPTRLPAPRELPADPSVLVASVDDGPELRGLEHDRSARDEEVALAKLQWIPDVNPSAAVTGSVEQMVGVAIVLPTTIAETLSGIDVARAMRGAATARLVQARRDKVAELRAAVIDARNAERSRALLEQRVLPAAEVGAAAIESSYSSGSASLADAVEARSVLVDTRKEIAAAAIDREKQLAAVEEIAGADLETFADPLRFARAGQAMEGLR